MSAWVEVAFLAVLTALTPLLGRYMASVFEGPPAGARRFGCGFEHRLYALCRIDPEREMSARTYLCAVLALSAVCTAALFALLCTQARLPLNPQHFPNLPPLLAFDIAISFMTTTDWQAYAGEGSLSYLSQMAGLGWQNFVAAAIGLAVAVALIRGLVRAGAGSVGNFWVDLTRAILYILLPLSIAGAVLLTAQGTPQNFRRTNPCPPSTAGTRRSPAGRSLRRKSLNSWA